MSIRKSFNFEYFNHEFSLNEQGLTTFLNPYSYVKAREHYELFRRFDRIYADGILLVLALRMAGYKASRKSFDMTSLARSVFANAERTGKKIVFVGGEKDIAEKARRVIRAKYPNLNIVKSYSGFFSDDS